MGQRVGTQAGENQQRVQAAAVECLAHLASVRDAGLQNQGQMFLRPEKATQWKRVLGRLQVLPALVELTYDGMPSTPTTMP